MAPADAAIGTDGLVQFPPTLLTQFPSATTADFRSDDAVTAAVDIDFVSHSVSNMSLVDIENWQFSNDDERKKKKKENRCGASIQSVNRRQTTVNFIGKPKDEETNDDDMLRAALKHETMA